MFTVCSFDFYCKGTRGGSAALRLTFKPARFPCASDIGDQALAPPCSTIAPTHSPLSLVALHVARVGTVLLRSGQGRLAFVAGGYGEPRARDAAKAGEPSAD